MRNAILALCLCVSPLAAEAQQPWPAKPVRLLIASGPGATPDIAGRVFADHFARRIGQAVAVDNRPGGDEMIAAQAAAAAAPDGHTLYFATQAPLAINQSLHKSMPYDPVRDLTAIAVICDDSGPQGIFAHPSAPFTTLPGMVEYAKANPGKLAYATTVPLFSIMGEWLQRRGGMHLTEVRYKSTPQATQDVLSGVVPIYMIPFGLVEPHLKAGKLRVLAVTQRQPDIAQIPTVAEAFPGFSFPGAIFLMGPAKIPADTVQRINAAVGAVVADAKFNEQLKPLRWQNVEGARTPQGTAELIRTLRERWAKFVEESGRKPE